MSEIRRLATKWLDLKRKSVASVDAVFQHEKLNIPIKATRAQREEDFDNDTGGVSEKAVYQDFIVSRDELIRERDTGFWTSRVVPTDPDYEAKTYITPEPGDRIIIGSEIYELAPRDNIPCLENSDAAGLLIRIHAHLIRDKKAKVRIS